MHICEMYFLSNQYDNNLLTMADSQVVTPITTESYILKPPIFTLIVLSNILLITQLTLMIMIMNNLFLILVLKGKNNILQ